MTLRKPPLLALLPLLLATTLAGCGAWWLPRPHKVDIQQGNLLDASAVEQIEEGMSKAQVQATLGNPLLLQTFHPDRWNYIFSVNRSGEQPDGQRLTLYFSEGRITKIERSDIGSGR